MWLAPGIIVMQACTIFFPVYSSYHSQRLSHQTLSTLQSWEERSRWTADTTTLGSRSTHTHSSPTIHQKASFRTEKSQYRDNEMYEMTIAALENAIATNPLPLLQFAATKDFTAENILFLIQIRDWKSAWRSSCSPPTPHSRAVLFNKAVEIYAQSVNEKLAVFPINVEGGIRSRLDVIFEPAVRKLRERNGDGEVVDPFNEVTPFAGGEGEMPLSPMSPISSSKPNWPLPSTPTTPKSHFSTEVEVRDYSREIYGKSVGDVPEEFDQKVFDAAEKSIKYLVVTNTWRKMISEIKESPRTSHEGIH
jgi:hypothetical protein